MYRSWIPPHATVPDHSEHGNEMKPANVDSQDRHVNTQKLGHGVVYVHAFAPVSGTEIDNEIVHDFAHSIVPAFRGHGYEALFCDVWTCCLVFAVENETQTETQCECEDVGHDLYFAI